MTDLPVAASQALAVTLKRGAGELGLDLSDDQIRQLLSYLGLFDKWNRTYNLSAIRDPDAMLTRHLLDSLSVAPLLRDAPGSDGRAGPQRIIDVGTGGGLPGIPLAIAFPEKQITLLDSNGKKTRFLFQVKVALELENIRVENQRVEDFRPAQGFDCVISRAFASLGDMTAGCAHLLAPRGRFWAMKGQYPEDELSVLAKHYKVEGCHRLQVPGGEGERHLLILAPISGFSQVRL